MPKEQVGQYQRQRNLEYGDEIAYEVPGAEGQTAVTVWILKMDTGDWIVTGSSMQLNEVDIHNVPTTKQKALSKAYQFMQDNPSGKLSKNSYGDFGPI